MSHWAQSFFGVPYTQKAKRQSVSANGCTFKAKDMFTTEDKAACLKALTKVSILLDTLVILPCDFFAMEMPKWRYNLFGMLLILHPETLRRRACRHWQHLSIAVSDIFLEEQKTSVGRIRISVFVDL